MKALSILEPWAWLIAAGKKDIENRDWHLPAGLAGERIVIHASKGQSYVKNLEEYEDVRDFVARLNIELPAMKDLAYGAAIGTAKVVDCVRDHESPFFFGPYGFVMAEAELWAKPVPMKGALMFWDFPEKLLPGNEWMLEDAAGVGAAAGQENRFTMEELAECAEREFAMRRDKYPGMQGGMTKFRQRQTDMMEVIARRLRGECAPAMKQGTLFDESERSHNDRG